MDECGNLLSWGCNRESARVRPDKSRRYQTSPSLLTRSFDAETTSSLTSTGPTDEDLVTMIELGITPQTLVIPLFFVTASLLLLLDGSPLCFFTTEDTVDVAFFLLMRVTFVQEILQCV